MGSTMVLRRITLNQNTKKKKKKKKKRKEEEEEKVNKQYDIIPTDNLISWRGASPVTSGEGILRGYGRQYITARTRH
jgi:hypothetical protein